MVDISSKQPSLRIAVAESIIKFPTFLMDKLQSSGGEMVGPKGPIFSTATVAGVMAVKKTSELIPFCHPIPIDDCKIAIEPTNATQLRIECTVKVRHTTGVEMEALTGASVAALCVYDMCKALSHDISIEETRLISKSGGKSAVQNRAKGHEQQENKKSITTP